MASSTDAQSEYGSGSTDNRKLEFPMMSLHSEAIPSFFGDMPLKLVSALAIAAAMTFATNTPAIAQDGIPGPEEDSYIWLEEARSDRALDWVRAENERTTELLAGDPRFDEVKA